MKIFDISLTIEKGMLSYPKNPRPQIKSYNRIPKNRTNSSLIIMGSHTGTHVDTKLHIKNNGTKADKLPLSSFYGPARVLDLTKAGKEIQAKHLKKFKIKKGEIILLKTENSIKSNNKFRKDFAHLKLDAGRYLVNKKIKTLGFDYLSVKKFGGAHEVHEILINHLTLFEGLLLKNIEPGKYLFIGLPLKIKTDGSPARAILIKT